MRTALIVAISAIMFSSCVKVYNCECKKNGTSDVVKSEISSNSKSRARQSCTEYGLNLKVVSDSAYTCDVSAK